MTPNYQDLKNQYCFCVGGVPVCDGVTPFPLPHFGPSCLPISDLFQTKKPDNQDYW